MEESSSDFNPIWRNKMLVRTNYQNAESPYNSTDSYVEEREVSAESFQKILEKSRRDVEVDTTPVLYDNGITYFSNKK
jgi:hypothetical protein